GVRNGRHRLDVPPPSEADSAESGPVVARERMLRMVREEMTPSRHKLDGDVHVPLVTPGASDGGACSMNCACPPARSSGMTASRATDAATSAPRSRRTM